MNAYREKVMLKKRVHISRGGINASKVPDTDGIPDPQLDRHKTRITILPDVQVTPLCPSKAVEKIRAELECNRGGECLTSLFLADVKPVDFWPHYSLERFIFMLNPSSFIFVLHS